MRTPRHFNVLLYFSCNSSITLEKWYQSAICYLAEALAAQGKEVFLLNNTSESGMSPGVDCRRRVGDKSHLELLRSLDFLVIVNIVGKALEIKPLLGHHTKLILWINEPGFVFLQ
ncbi:hypothetical protein, partial [Microcoleus sp. N9_A1]|uniref:hypothetical protein n=1 Tax=Microcoleus sp. N9_A1 TaxID=3055380 RepID=UPI002FD72D0F